MKKLALAIAFLGSLASAHAADLPVKAPPVSPWLSGAYPYQTSGPIFGIYTEGGVGQVSATVPGVSAASLTTTTAAIGGTVGYAWGRKGSPIAYTLEADFGVTNFNGSTQGLSLQGPLSFEQRVTFFTPFSNIANLFPNLPNLFGGNPVPPFQPLPPGVIASNLQSGFAVGVKEKDVSAAFAGFEANKIWRTYPVVRLVAMEQLSNGSALRAYMEAGFPDKGRIFGPVPNTSAVLGPEYTAGVGVMW